jgi:hypothetical protein
MPDEPLDHTLWESLGQAFQAIIEHQRGKPGKKGRKPFRAQQFWELFRGRENSGIPLEELAKSLQETTNPSSYAQTEISKLNGLFESLGFDIEIERFVLYRFRRRSHKR